MTRKKSADYDKLALVISKVIKNPMQAILALTGVFGFFIILGVLLYADVPEGQRDLLLTLLGALVTIVIQIYQFYFGTSKGSQEKTEVMHKMTRGKPDEKDPEP